MKDGNPDEWAVAFHGVGDPSYFAVPKISREGLKVGIMNASTGRKCIKTGLVI